MYIESQYEEFEKRMVEAYPKMFAEPYGGFAVGPGWWPILESLCGQIQHHLDWKNKKSDVVAQVTVDQIKEKFGGLRFYYSGGDDASMVWLVWQNHGRHIVVKLVVLQVNVVMVVGLKLSVIIMKQNVN